MKTLLLSACLCASLPAWAVAPGPGPGEGQWRFTALLDGKPIGEHDFTVKAQGDKRSVDSEASFTVKFLGVTAYRYRHKAIEQWNGDCLSSIVANTNDDGKESDIRSTTDGKVMTTNAKTGNGSAEGCVMTFAYWNPAILKQTRLLNAQSGEFEAVQIAAVGSEDLEVRGQVIKAERYRISGPPQPVDVLYTPGGEWVGLDSTVAGGRKLTYRLK